MDCPNCEAMDWPSLPDGTYTCSVCHQTYYLRTSGARTAPPQITHHCPGCEASARELAEANDEIARLRTLKDAEPGQWNAALELADLRARLAAILDEYDHSIDLDAQEAIRALLRKEAK